MSESRTEATANINLALRNGTLVIVLDGGEIEIASKTPDDLALLGPVLMRVLLQQERKSRRVGDQSAPTRFYLMHLERHQRSPHVGCQWCEEEELAEQVLAHPITRVAMTARSLRVAAITDDLAEELGL